jgi:hypothetical protein
MRPYLEKPFTKKGWWNDCLASMRSWVQNPYCPKQTKTQTYFKYLMFWEVSHFWQFP